MSAIAIFVDGANSADPYDLLHIDFTVIAEGVSSGWTGDVSVEFDAPADEINATIRAAAVTIAANHSVTVSSTDTQRVIGGALETPS